MPLVFPGEGRSETYGELIILGWLNRAVLWQTLDDGNGTVELCLSGHYRISRWRRARLTVVDGYGWVKRVFCRQRVSVWA